MLAISVSKDFAHGALAGLGSSFDRGVCVCGCMYVCMYVNVYVLNPQTLDPKPHLNSQGETSHGIHVTPVWHIFTASHETRNRPSLLPMLPRISTWHSRSPDSV